MDGHEEPRAVEARLPGQEDALSALVAQYQQPVGRYLLYLVGDLSLALRLVEEAFMCAYRAHAATRSELAVRPWLYCAATRLALRRPGLNRRSAQRPQSHPEAGLDGTAAERALVQSALLDLPAGERAVLLLCDFEQLPRDEVAAILAVSADRLSRRLERARARFRIAYVEHHALERLPS